MPWVSRTTASPSTVADVAGRARMASTMAGPLSVQSSALWEKIRARSPLGRANET